MLTRPEVLEVLRRIKYRDWEFTLHPYSIPSGGWIMTVAFVDEATMVRQRGRGWYISCHSCQSEIVQTCLKAILTAVEHEAREQFLFDGESIYGPHLDAEALLGIRRQMREPKVDSPEQVVESLEGATAALG
jgi:hypothetical protein